MPGLAQEARLDLTSAPVCEETQVYAPLTHTHTHTGGEGEGRGEKRKIPSLGGWGKMLSPFQ